MKTMAKVKESTTNVILSYALEYADVMSSAKKEAKNLLNTNDNDIILIIMGLLTEPTKISRLTCKNDYAKKLKIELEKLFNINKKTKRRTLNED